jgi:hypothetical protein
LRSRSGFHRRVLGDRAHVKSHDLRHAIRNSATYDDDISRKRSSGKSGDDLFFELALTDLTRAAELFQPIFARTDGVDGWVSLEVSPLLAHDTNATLAAARTLHQSAGKPNLFIKIPGTPEGLPAIEAVGLHDMEWADYLRDQAARYRQLAEQTDDPVIKNEMLELASVCQEGELERRGVEP